MAVKVSNTTVYDPIDVISKWYHSKKSKEVINTCLKRGEQVLRIFFYNLHYTLFCKLERSEFVFGLVSEVAAFGAAIVDVLSSSVVLSELRPELAVFFQACTAAMVDTLQKRTSIYIFRSGTFSCYCDTKM
jgi:hypothetical protein